MNRALSIGRRSHLALVQSDSASEAFAPSGRILSFFPLPMTLTYLDSISTESIFKLESSLSLNAELYITSIIALSLFETLLDASMLQRVSTSLIDKIFGNFFDNFGVLMSIIGLIEIIDVLRRNKKYDLKEIIRGDSIFCATGITSGDLVKGIIHKDNYYITETLVTHKSSNICKIVTRKDTIKT